MKKIVERPIGCVYLANTIVIVGLLFLCIFFYMFYTKWLPIQEEIKETSKTIHSCECAEFYQ